MSDEDAMPQSAGHLDERPAEDVAILAAIEKARRASAEGRVYSLDHARQSAAHWRSP